MAERYAPYPHLPFYSTFIPKAEVGKFSMPINVLAPQVRAAFYGTQTPRTVPLQRNQITGRTLPRFLVNLWTMLNDESIKCIQWSGINSFVVTSREGLSRDVLPKFFKHNRLSSFTRQLHMYQFEKAKDKGILEWTHRYLNRGNYNLLSNIRRKQSNEDQKLQLVAEDLVVKVQEQEQKISDLQCRMGVLESDLKRSRELHTAMGNQLLAVREVLRAMSCPRSNPAPHF